MDLKLVEGKEIVNMYRTMVFNPLDGHDPLEGGHMSDILHTRYLQYDS